VSGQVRTTSKLRVRYAETDQMGVVYHTHYLVWCEIGRTDFIRALGVTYAALERAGLFLAVAEANVRYAGAARYDDAIRVDTWVERVQSRTITFGYEIAREDEDDDDGAAVRLATATTKLIALDGRGATRALPSSLLGRFRALLEADPA
jgi:acyl-CoA thioester hydrolase